MATEMGDWDGSEKSLGNPVLDAETQRNSIDRRVRRKVDLNLIPLIAVLYLCSFL